jgi:hypothetical protein
VNVDQITLQGGGEQKRQQEYDSRDDGGDIQTPGEMGYSGSKYDDEIPF